MGPQGVPTENLEELLERPEKQEILEVIETLEIQIKERQTKLFQSRANCFYIN